MNIKLDGRVAASNIKEQLKIDFNNLPRQACLAIIRFNDLASESYLKGRLKIANELNVKVEVFTIEEHHDTAYLLSLIESLNNDSKIDEFLEHCINYI